MQALDSAPEKLLQEVLSFVLARKDHQTSAAHHGNVSNEETATPNE